MASNTNASEKRRARRHKNMGRRRKNTTGRKSTPSMAELFAGFGEPGQPAPAATEAKPVAKAALVRTARGAAATSRRAAQ